MSYVYTVVYIFMYTLVTSFQPYWLHQMMRPIYSQKMADIFENPILCKKCNKQMERADLVRNGFPLRAMACKKCAHKVLHPVDEQEYNRFINLKNREFRVKMRLVGNSYSVSIPKEIVLFMREQEKMMDDMVRLCFEDMGRLSLNFKELLEEKR